MLRSHALTLFVRLRSLTRASAWQGLCVRLRWLTPASARQVLARTIQFSKNRPSLATHRLRASARQASKTCRALPELHVSASAPTVV